MAASIITVIGCMIVILGFLAAFWRDFRGEVNGLRGEIGGLHGEIGGLRSEMRTEIGGLRGEMRDEIGGLRGEVHQLGERMARVEGRLDERGQVAG